VELILFRTLGWILQEEGLMSMKEIYDDREIYCRKLGHFLTFKYCRTEVGHLPCKHIRSCWYTQLQIDDFLGKNYLPLEINYLFEPPTSKMLTIYNLIRKMK
jgi:hypothetical protein